MSAAAAPAARSKKPVRRVDPRPRHVDGTAPLMRLKNQNPEKVYRAASVSDPVFGLQRYVAMGWAVEVYTGEPNCLQFAGGQTCKKGDPLESMGHVIVSMPAKRYADIVQYGEDGASGQAETDEIEERIIDRGSMRDAVRGLGGSRYFEAINKTTPAREELIGPGVDDGDADPFGG